MVVYVRTTTDDNVGPVTVFLGIAELTALTATTAKGIETAFCLITCGFTEVFLLKHWICLGVDRCQSY